MSLLLTYFAYLFVGEVISVDDTILRSSFAVSVAVILIGIFIMVFRMKALSHVLGILTMENGLFLSASIVSGGLPFFVEIAIFFDIFVCVIIMGVFVYKINKVFTHIDVDKLSELKG